VRPSARRSLCACRLELCREESLVDLPLIDRNTLLEAETDHLLAIHVHLLRQLLGRQVVRHALLLSLWVEATKKPGTGWRHGLEGSLVGRAIHHSLSSFISTL
jgi:hypothetical protein